MDPEFIQAFIEETESYLPTIRGGILIYLQEGKIFGELELSMRQLYTIRGAALMIGLDEIGQLASRLENEITEIISQSTPLAADAAAKLLDTLAQIEKLLLAAKLNDDEFTFDPGDFIDQSFDNLQIGNSHKGAENELCEADFGDEFSDVIKVENEEDFEIDDEMLEIFSMEAEDLLRSINSNLEILKNQPANLEALMEVRRNAHTFKGSAGIVGLRDASALAHRVEDLLDYLAEYDIPGDESIFRLLLDSTDCLSAMTSGEKSENWANKVKRLYEEFDVLTVSFEQTDDAAGIESAVVIPAEISVQAAPEAAILKTEIEESNDFQNNPLLQANPKSVVRVSLEKLDDLVKVVRDLAASRAAFEQRLGELDRQIDELTNSTRRLQRSTAKLETDFEADMLSVQNPIFKAHNHWSAAESFQPAFANLQSFDALEFDHYTEFHQTTRELVETTSDTLSINSALDGLRGNLETLFDSQRHSIEELQDKLLRIRMVSFGSLSARLHRTIRLSCDEDGKQADLFIKGEQLEIDTQILDSLTEPMLHLLRNSVAHGIEPPDTRRLLGKPERGKINLSIHNEGTHITLTIADDGRGISASALKEKAVRNHQISRETADLMSEDEAFELIFLPGITTAEKLSQTAGRGVGMDIVRTAVARRQGTISIASAPQKGATFTIRLPMALSVTRALLVKAGDRDFAFPISHFKQISEASAEMLEKAGREKYLQLGSVKYSVHNLSGLLGFPSPPAAGQENTPLLLLETADNACALIVDKIVKPEEIVVKPLGFALRNMPETLGAAILGDGSVVPVLDLFFLLTRKHRVIRKAAETAPVKRKISVMIVDDSPSVRHLNTNLVKKAGFNHVVAKDGLEALEILQTAQTLPDVILTDVEMPRMDGYELLSSLKRNENLSYIPVVMITSRAGEKHRLKALELGVSEYLTKPFDDLKLIETILNLTGT